MISIPVPDNNAVRTPRHFPDPHDTDPDSHLVLGIWWWHAADIVQAPPDPACCCWDGFDIDAFKDGAPMGWGHEEPDTTTEHLTAASAEHYDRPVTLIPALGGIEMDGVKYMVPCYWIVRNWEAELDARDANLAEQHGLTDEQLEQE